MTGLAVHYQVRGEARTREVRTTNANFAREIVLRDEPEARIVSILAIPGRQG